MTEKDLRWIGNSYKDLLAFPEEARREAGYQLGFVQLGVEPTDWRPMSNLGQGVQEIRIHVQGEFRVLFIANYAEAVFVLHCFQKKARTTSRKDLNIARARLRKLQREWRT